MRRRYWEATLAEPHYFALQGILYLADVAEDQGACSCLPRFHCRLKEVLMAMASLERALADDLR